MISPLSAIYFKNFNLLCCKLLKQYMYTKMSEIICSVSVLRPIHTTTLTTNTTRV